MNSQNGLHYVSKEKLAELEAELKFLKTVRRKEVAESLNFAKSLGDLSENAEYQEALDAQAKLEDRIATVEDILKNPTIVEDVHGNSVYLGSTVVVKKEGETATQRYFVVGSEEVNYKENKISNESPLGKALIGKKKGETVAVATPKGAIKYTIDAIE